MVDDRLEAGNREGTLSGGAVDYLAAVLQRYVYGQPQSLKTDPILRKATFAILDRLVDAGSSAAYRMRDDFVTPNTTHSIPSMFS